MLDNQAINWQSPVLQCLFTTIEVTTTVGRGAHMIKVDIDNNTIQGRPSKKYSTYYTTPTTQT